VAQAESLSSPRGFYACFYAPLKACVSPDLGGGTFDVSILELFDGIMEVRATAGDTFLDGEDFVEALMEGFIERAARPAGVSDTARNSQFYRLLRLQAEKAKRDPSLGSMRGGCSPA
jgi:hypothetical protein